MVSKFSRLFVCLLVLVAGLMFANSELLVCPGNGSFCDKPGLDEVEPDIGAGRSHSSAITVTKRTPLSFGALVGGRDNRYIELSPDGTLITSGDIVGQSHRSYIGDVNLGNFSSINPLYRIRPGRLTFSVGHIYDASVVTVEFFTGELASGVTLSGLVANVGPDTSSGFLRLPNTAVNRIQFQATQSMTNANVDLGFGGRLELAGSLRGEVDAPVHINITVSGSSVETDSVVVYEHVNYSGREWSLQRGVYSNRRVRKSTVGDNRISSIEVPSGYKVAVCDTYYYGNCRKFTSSVADLREYGFNDLTSSIKVWQY